MPGVDFETVRRELTMEQVLDLLGFQPSTRSGVQWYGGCPLHASPPGHRRSFSLNWVTLRVISSAETTEHGLSRSCSPAGRWTHTMPTQEKRPPVLGKLVRPSRFHRLS